MKRFIFGLVMVSAVMAGWSCATQQLPQQAAKNDSNQDLFGISDLRGGWQGRIYLVGGVFGEKGLIKVFVNESTSKIWEWKFTLESEVELKLTFKEESPQKLVLIPDPEDSKAEGWVNFTRDGQAEAFDLYVRSPEFGLEVKAHLLYELNDINGSVSMYAIVHKQESIKIELSREKSKDRAF